MPNKKNAKLNATDRTFIEEGIRRRDSMSAIARKMGVSASTVIREIKRNRVPESPRYLMVNSRNICRKADACRRTALCEGGCLDFCRKCRKFLCNSLCPEFDPEPCPLLEKPPYCCNECGNRYGYGCDHPCLFYDAHMANELAGERKVESRIGIDCTEEDLALINEIVTPLVKKGQSPEVIWATHGEELPVGFRTYYNYVDMGIMDVVNLELPKKARLRPRKKKRDRSEKRGNLEGHLYEDFKRLPEEKRMKAVQMDCVEGKSGELPAILTLTFPSMKFQILLYLEVQDQVHVKRALDSLQALLGEDYEDVFEVVLTDRGSEFLDPEKIEFGKNGVKRSSVYYCDPVRSDQKPHCERNHGELRRIIKKGTSLLPYEASDMPLIASHLNSYLRPELNYVAPLSLAMKRLPAALFEGLGFELLDPDDVVMRPALVAHIAKRAEANS